MKYHITFQNGQDFWKQFTYFFSLKHMFLLKFENTVYT